MSGQARSHKLRNFLVTGTIVFLALASGFWVSNMLFNRPHDMSGLQATYFSSPREIRPFSLVDHTGNVFSNDALGGHWSFVFFGYTHCPDVCPTTLSVLNSAAGKLEKRPETARFIFISVDPERDTPEKLGQYVTYFNGEFIGVTGTEAALGELTRELGVMYMRVMDESGAGNYLVDHTASVLLFDPAGRFHAVFSPPLDAEVIVNDFSRIVEAYR